MSNSINTGYRVNSIDIADLLESFTTEEQSEGGVTDSVLSDTNEKFRKNGSGIKSALNITFPTSAGQYIGYQGYFDAFRVGRTLTDVALKGRRPIGVLRATLGVGTWYVNRINGQTWVSSSPNSASGTRLDHDPWHIFIELQAGGGGGAGGSALYASSGGGGGAYCFKAITIPDNSYIRVEVGAGGNGGAAGTGNNGETGGNTICYDSAGEFIARAYGGYGGAHNNDYTVEGGQAIGGDVNVSGGNGGTKENAGSGVSAFTVTLPKPEQTQWTRGGFSGGSSPGNNHGGGGGASAFANGGNGDRDNPAAGRLGSGGGGGGYRLEGTAGAAGGAGEFRVYY